MTIRYDNLRAILDPHLNGNGWSEDPMIVLRVLHDQALMMIADLAERQPGAYESQAYWRLVADETDALRERVYRKFSGRG